MGAGMTGVRFDTDLAVRFLIGRPGFPVLTAIRVDPVTKKKGLIETKSFPLPVSKAALWEWIEGRQGKSNLYYSLNPLIKPIDSKAERTDLAAMVSLHVDLDPRAGEEQEPALKRIMAQLTAYPVPPSTVISSGGGVQAIWDLDPADHIAINGDLAKAEDAKLYNIQLERELGGDNCHNIDRILRVPGTVNVAHDLKLKKGRHDAPATIIYQSGRTYPLKTFTKAVQVQEKSGSAPSAIKVKAPTNVERINLDDIANLKGWVRQHIVLGKDPDGVKVYASRSEGLFAVACDLVRTGLKDEDIYAIITDPDYRISDSVLDKKDPTREATRVIGRAREFAIDPDLARLNARYAVIMNIGGKCRILTEYYDHVMACKAIAFMSFDDFRNAYSNQFKEVTIDDGKGNTSTKRVPLGVWWLAQLARRQYDRIAFSPEVELDGVYNLWAGFGVDSRPGDCSLYLQHLREHICSGDESTYQYVVNWMARSVQKPASSGEVMLTLRGKEGVGKGMTARWWGKMFGRHFRHITNPEHLTGKFNSHLEDCVALFADEAFYAGDKRHESIIKTLITEPTLMVERKGVDAIQMPNYTHIISASNSDWVVPASSEARRYCVLDVADSKMQDSDYFGLIEQQMRGGGVEALLNFLLKIDLTGFDVRKAPRTEALHDQQVHTLGQDDSWWESKLQAGEVFPGMPWTQPVIEAQLLEDYYNETQRMRSRAKSRVALMRFLKTRCFPGDTQPAYVDQTLSERVGKRMVERRARMPAFRLPPLAECRAHWTKVRHGVRWQEPQAEEQVTDVDIPF